MNTQANQVIKVGDKVAFDNGQVEIFKAETNLDNKEIQQFRKLVLTGVYQVGILRELGLTMATVTYP